jgi:hypothetical protein
MKTLLSDALKHLVRARDGVPRGATKALDAIATDLGSKKQEVSEHREKAQDAIDRGTKLTKRRIPL